MKVRNIMFLMPSDHLGGAQLLFIRCARELSKQSAYNVFYVDYRDGISHSILIDEHVHFIDYSDGDHVSVPDNTLVIHPLGNIVDIRQKFLFDKKKVAFLLWAIHPGGFTRHYYIKGKVLLDIITKKKLCKCVQNLSEMNIIRYMDYSNYASIHDTIKVNLSDVRYLPVPIEDKFILKESKSYKVFDKDEISFMWLSRMDKDKTDTLISVMNELDCINAQYRIKLYIVGYGSNERDILDNIPKHSYPIEYLGKMYGPELTNFIDSNVDIGLAMGTSLLEIAKRKKPAVICATNQIYKSGILKNYCLLNETYAFTLGGDQGPNKSIDGFSNIVNRLIDNYGIISDETINYVKNNHSLNSVVYQILCNIKEIEMLNIEQINYDLLWIAGLFEQYPFLKLARFFRQIINKFV